MYSHCMNYLSEVWYIPFAYIESNILSRTMTSILFAGADKILHVLNFNGCVNPHFLDDGIGKIGTTGFVLGALCGLHFGLAIMATVCMSYTGYIPFLLTLRSWSAYMALLTLFHFLEFFITAVRQSKNLSFDSFVVTHGRSYTLAAIASWIEFWVENMFWSKSSTLCQCISWLGIVTVVVGQIVRSLAMWTCGSSFSHIIVDEKPDDHVLISHGIYRYLRHPSYFGWFYWSIGTQLILCNPICVVLYTLASWYFFSSRIPFEEYTLHEFYGPQYVQYVQSTVVGIPFIKPFPLPSPNASSPNTQSQSQSTRSGGDSFSASVTGHDEDEDEDGDGDGDGSDYGKVDEEEEREEGGVVEVEIADGPGGRSAEERGKKVASSSPSTDPLIGTTGRLKEE